MSTNPDPDNSDPIENFYMQLQIARLQADDKNWRAAYQTLVVAYDNLLGQHDEAIEEILGLRKRLQEEIANRDAWRQKATGI